MFVVSARSNPVGNGLESEGLDDGFWYIKNNLKSIRLSKGLLDWKTIPLTTPYDLDIPLEKLSLKRKVKIALIEESLDIRHPFFKNYVKTNYAPYNPKHLEESLKHGTHTAGILAAVFNALNISPLVPTEVFEIVPIALLNDSLFFIDVNNQNSLEKHKSSLKSALRSAIKENVNVISVSSTWFPSSHDQELENLLNEIEKSGIVVVAAAGNRRSNSIFYPCAHPATICVGSAQQDGSFSEYFKILFDIGSNYGPRIDVLAPGTKILSSLYSLNYEGENSKSVFEYSGTSESTPMVAAQVAVLSALYPGISITDIKARIFLSSVNKNDLLISNVTSSQYGAISFKKSISIDLERIKDFEVPLYLKENIRTLTISNDGLVQVPFEISCLLNQCDGMQVSIKLNQLSSNREAIVSTSFKNFEFPSKTVAVANSSVKFLIPFQVSLSGSHKVDFEVEFKNSKSSKKIKGYRLVQVGVPANQFQRLQLSTAEQEVSRDQGIISLNHSGDRRFFKNLLALYFKEFSDKFEISLIGFEKNEVLVKKIFSDILQIKYAFIGDSNADGKADLQIVALHRDKKYYLYHLDQSLNSLYSNLQLPLLISVNSDQGGNIYLPTEANSIKWIKHKFEDQIILLPAFLLKYPIKHERETLGLLPSSFRNFANTNFASKQFVVLQISTENNIVPSPKFLNLDFYKQLYLKLGLNVNDELQFIEPMSFNPSDLRFLVYARKGSAEGNFIVTIREDLSFDIEPLQISVPLSPRSQLIRNQSQLVASGLKGLMTVEYGFSQFGIFYFEENNVTSFELKSEAPLLRIVTVYRKNDRVYLIGMTTNGLELWSYKHGDLKPTLHDSQKINYHNSLYLVDSIKDYVFFRFDQNNSPSIRFNSAHKMNGIGDESFWTVSVDHASEKFTTSLADTYQIPKGCSIWSQSSSIDDVGDKGREIFSCWPNLKSDFHILNY